MKRLLVILAVLMAVATPALAQSSRDSDKVQNDLQNIYTDGHQLKADKKAGNKAAIAADREKGAMDQARLQKHQQEAAQGHDEHPHHRHHHHHRKHAEEHRDHY